MQMKTMLMHGSIGINIRAVMALTTMELYSNCEVAKEFIPVVERDIKVANAVTVTSSLVQRVDEVQCM